MSPDHADDGDRVAVLEVVDVGVALDLADLAGVDLLLEHVEGRVELVLGEVLGDVDALGEHQHAHRVAHLGEDLDLALEVGRPQVVDAS